MQHISSVVLPGDKFQKHQSTVYIKAPVDTNSGRHMLHYEFFIRSPSIQAKRIWWIEGNWRDKRVLYCNVIE